MEERAPPDAAGAAGRQDRFDGESARRILERAAVEQHRLDNALADSFSLAELEEMAAEARISPEALRAAIDAERRGLAPARSGGETAPASRHSRHWPRALAGLRPAVWSPDTRSIVLTGTSFFALSGVLVSLWAFAPTFFWATSVALIALSLLALLGGTPF